MRRPFAFLALAILALALLTPAAAALRDDFDGTSLDTSVWDVRQSGKLSYSVDNGVLRINCGSAITQSYLWIYTEETFTTPVVIETRFRAKTGSSSTKSIYLHQGLLTGSSPAYAVSSYSGIYLHANYNDNLNTIRYVSGSSAASWCGKYDPSGWNTYRIVITATDIKVYDASGTLLGSAPHSYSSGKLAIGWPDWNNLAGWAEIDYIEINPLVQYPTADFSATPTSGKDPLTVQFTDTSNGEPTVWHWNFGDGYTSTAQNPSHIYLYPGQYSVSLTVENAAGYDSIAKPYLITVTPSQVRPTADFSASPTAGTAPLTVSFTDESAGTPTSWSWEFGDGWGSSARNPTHSYVAPGTYTVTLTAHNSIGSDVETKTAYIVVGDTPQPADAILNGYTFDTTNNALLDGVTVTLESDTYSATNVSHSGGFYQFAGLIPGVYTVKGEKAGYLASPDYAVAVYSGAVVQKDIAVGASGVVVTGTVYDALTGETLNGAVVTGVQGSASYNYTSTGAGQYALNGLSKGVEITLNAALAGYTHTPITVTPTSTSAYTAHLYLLPDTIAHNGTALAGLVTRSDTHEAIPNAQVILPGHANATTSQTGFYLFNDLTPGAYYVSATAAGYADSRDYAVNLTEENLTSQDISLDRGIETATYMEYPPHLVRFLCIDEYNRPIQNVTISAIYQESSSPIDWLAEWLGIAPNVQITTETLEGTTGIDGSVVFLMVQSVQYQITTTAPDLGGMTKTFSIYPKEDEITIRFRTSTHPDLSTMPTYELTATEIDDENILLALNYHDTTNATTSLTFTVTDHATGELIFSETFGSTNFPGWVNVTTGAENIKGGMYRFGFTAENSNHGEISSYKGLTTKGSTLLVDLGFEDRSLYAWLAIILMFLFAGAFSGTNVKQGAILVPLFGGGLFWYIGWLPIAIGAVISAIAFLGALVYMRKSEWKLRS